MFGDAEDADKNMTRLDELTSPPATHGGAPLPLWSSLSRGGEDLGEFLENAAMALHWMGPDGSILWANQAELELLGYSREEYIGHPIAEFHVSQPEIEDILRRLREKEELQDYEAALRCKDGSIRWVLITSNVYWRDGEFIHTRCFTKDITERKRMEESLQQALARLDTERTLFREVIRQMPLGVVVAEAGSGDILIRNPHVERLTGRTLPPHQKLREVQGLPSFHPDGRPYEAHEFPLMRALEGGEEVREEEIRLVRPDGSQVTVRASAAPVRDASGKTLAAVTTVYDITERKQAEERRHFADEAGRLLSSSLDYEWTLRALAHLAVPRIADWCAVDMLDEDGALQRLEVVHVDPAKVEYAHELQRRYPVDRNAPRGLAAILRTGAPEFIPVISEELLAATARDQEQLRIIRELGLHSYIGVPLIARERVLGALTLVSAESARTYTEADLEFALELARRAAAAVDNAQLYTAAQREIAERQEAEAALRASEERLRFTLEAAHVGTWNWNMRTNKLEWSENLLKIHGLSQDAFGGTFADFQNDIHPDDRGMVEAAIQRAIQGGGTYQVEYRLDPSGDALTWVEGKGRVIFDEKGQPAGMAGICMDVTERRLAEQRFRAAVESSPSAMVLVDAHGRIALVNTQTEFLFGYERQELLGQSIELLVPQRFRMAHPMFRAHFHAQPQARPMGMGRELFGLRKDGSEFPTEIALNPIQMPDGLYVLSTILDITERKRAEAALRQVNLELQQKNADLEQFVYTVSHDLKSPLVTVSGFIGLLREELAENQREEVYDCLDRLERATVRMGDLIDDLLELSRIGRVERPRVVCDTGRVMREIGEELVDRFHAAQARLVIQEGLPRLFIDPMRFTEVFENLLTNAIKYGCDRPDTQIEVGCEMDEAECRFFVRDEGPGIAPEYHERIFGLFQRLDTRNEGTGVGLAIVARIVQLAAGRAWVESAPGKGATFWAAFPRSLVRT